jgi:hypothetical protein
MYSGIIPHDLDLDCANVGEALAGCTLDQRIACLSRCLEMAREEESLESTPLEPWTTNEILEREA